MKNSSTYLKTIKVRVKDKHAPILRQMAREVNQVWNKANEISHEEYHVPVPFAGWVKGKWMSAFDMNYRFKGWTKDNSTLIGIDSVLETCEHHAKARNQFKKSKLRWRVSSGSKRSLGWVPFKKSSCQFRNGQVWFRKQYFKVWDSYGLSQYAFRAGSFSEDARGRWYFNVCVEVPKEPSRGTTAVGIDLGLKDYATCSDGVRLEATKEFRSLQEKLATEQRANNKKQVRNIHAKIKNKRSDRNHKFSNMLTKKHGMIVVGDVSSSKLAKTNMAKSVMDAGWYQLKQQLKYKANARSVVYLEVDEAYSTQICSGCGIKSGPKGLSGLNERNWVCSECKTEHDRDRNSALNILALGHQRLAGEISAI